MLPPIKILVANPELIGREGRLRLTEPPIWHTGLTAIDVRLSSAYQASVRHRLAPEQGNPKGARHSITFLAATPVADNYFLFIDALESS
jgi:hypothetical protein